MDSSGLKLDTQQQSIRNRPHMMDSSLIRSPWFGPLFDGFRVNVTKNLETVDATVFARQQPTDPSNNDSWIASC